jgi:hypothetical protein
MLPRPEVREQPFIDFSSGYVQRAVGMLPKQGDRNPWRLAQNYVLDLAALRFSPVRDDALRFFAGGGATAWLIAGAAVARGRRRRRMGRRHRPCAGVELRCDGALGRRATTLTAVTVRPPEDGIVAKLQRFGDSVLTSSQKMLAQTPDSCSTGSSVG